MKKYKIKLISRLAITGLTVLTMLLVSSGISMAQTSTGPSVSDASDETTNTTVLVKKVVKNTFESNLLIDAQTVMVPSTGTLEFDIQHRFGIVNNGYSDFYGLFAPAIIRLGLEYVPVKDLQLGLGLCSDRMQLDLNAKLAILKQKEGGMPLSLTYYGNVGIDTRAKSNFVTRGDRLTYFNQLMIARKITAAFSAQAALSVSHFNSVPGYFNSDGVIMNTVQNDQLTMSFMGRYKISNVMAILVDYDQPLTQNPTNNPHPNLAFGLEIITSSHCFQIIVGNCQYILPQNNALNNMNDYSKGQYLIGFNMTKLWSL